MEQEVLNKRDELLAELTVNGRQTLALEADYIQALNDIEQQDGFPDNVVWPTKP